MKRTLILILLLYSAGSLWNSCAIPVPPSGGPPDTTPPVLLASDPPDGSTEIQPRTIRLTFSEYIDPASFERAFSITPELTSAPRIRWKGKTVLIQLPDSLRPNTTYVLTIDTALKDWHNVSITQPIVLAFSTGKELHQGRIRGRVRNSWNLKGAAGIDIYAYRLPSDTTGLSSLAKLPDYRTQTDASGYFELKYLPSDPFFILALQDVNRNRYPEPLEAFAPPPIVPLVPDSTLPVYRWLLYRLDSLPPTPQLARALSSKRFEVRFSEPIHIPSQSVIHWKITNDSTHTTYPIHQLYQQTHRLNFVYGITDSLPPGTYQLTVGTVVDTVGNRSSSQVMPLSIPALPDTFHTRFIQFLPETLFTIEQNRWVLSPDMHPGLRFSSPPDTLILRSYLHVQDSSGAPISFSLRTSNFTDIWIQLDPPAIPFTLQLLPSLYSDSLQVQTYRFLQEQETGSVSGTVKPIFDAGRLVVEIHALRPGRLRKPQRQILLPPAYTFLFQHLLGGNYHLRVFHDAHANNRWDGGLILPYQPPEPLSWYPDSIRVRPRWETALDTLILSYPSTEPER